MKLKRTKILLKSREHSEAFQKYAIERGCSWYNSKDIKHTDQPIICIDGYLMFSYSDDTDLFEYFDYQEITFEPSESGESGVSNININGYWIPNITIIPQNNEYYIAPDLTHNKRKTFLANTESDITKFHYRHNMCYPNSYYGEFAAVLHHNAILYPRETK